MRFLTGAKISSALTASRYAEALAGRLRAGAAGLEARMSDQTIIIREIADVYKTLGSGFSEDVYARAMQVGLRSPKSDTKARKWLS